MKNKKIIVAINPWRVIDYIEEIDEKLEYKEHVLTRLMNVTASELLFLDAFYLNDLDPDQKSYVFYIDTRWSDDGFMKCYIEEGTQKNLGTLANFISEDLINTLILSIGEDNLWNLALNAGIKVVFTVPASRYAEIRETLKFTRSE